MTNKHAWKFNEFDAAVAHSLQDFLPSKVFDVHVHLYRVSDIIPGSPQLYSGGSSEVTRDVWLDHQEKQIGVNKLAGGLFVANVVCDLERENEFLFDHIRQFPGAKGLLAVTPLTPVKEVEEKLKSGLIAGFKPFCTYSGLEEPYQAPIYTFVPEWMWEMADHYGLVILVHLVRDKALADPENYTWIRQMCTKYPKAKLLLDHAARGFHAPNTIEGVQRISGLDNVYFDTSCICEVAPLMAIIQEFGTSRLMYGSDFPLSVVRGKTLSFGESFLWLTPDSPNWEATEGCNPTLIGLESLKAIRDCARFMHLSKLDVKNIFYHNAMNFLSK